MGCAATSPFCGPDRMLYNCQQNIVNHLTSHERSAWNFTQAEEKSLQSLNRYPGGDEFEFSAQIVLEKAHSAPSAHFRVRCSFLVRALSTQAYQSISLLFQRELTMTQVYLCRRKVKEFEYNDPDEIELFNSFNIFLFLFLTRLPLFAISSWYGDPLHQGLALTGNPKGK